MKLKIIILAILLTLIVLGGCITNETSTTSIQSKEVQCPNGLVNDPYPGSCGLYQDKNHNQICDLSE